MKMTIAVLVDSSWIGESEWSIDMPIPRIGDTISVEDFFPEFLENDWELGLNIEPYLEVSSVVYYKNSIEIHLNADK